MIHGCDAERVSKSPKTSPGIVYVYINYERSGFFYYYYYLPFFLVELRRKRGENEFFQVVTKKARINIRLDRVIWFETRYFVNKNYAIQLLYVKKSQFDLRWVKSRSICLFASLLIFSLDAHVHTSSKFTYSIEGKKNITFFLDAISRANKHFEAGATKFRKNFWLARGFLTKRRFRNQLSN